MRSPVAEIKGNQKERRGIKDRQKKEVKQRPMHDH
jgi:hypothetical protein